MRSLVQQQLGVDTGPLLGKSGGPGAESLARKRHDTGVRVPSGARAAFGQKSRAWERWESGVGSLAGEWRETEKEFLWGEERGIGTEFLEGVRQGSDAGFPLARRWGMTEVRSVGSPCPAAGPVFQKERTGLKASVQLANKSPK